MSAGHSPCPLCGSDRARKIGVRGTREYFGADPHAEPHIVTDVLRCGSCDLIYASPIVPEMRQLEREHYSDPDRYQATAEAGHAAMFARRLALIARFVPPGTLLDIGAGKGEFVAEALRKGWRADGLEPSSGFCAYAARELGVHLYEGHLDEVAALSDRQFDAITLNHVVEHVDRPRELLLSARRRLKADGVLFVEVPNCDSFLLRLADLYFRLRGLDWSSRLSPLHPPFHRYGYTVRSLRGLLESCGFEIRLVRTFSGRDRGYRGSPRAERVTRLRDIAARILDLFGNRELLCVVARQAGPTR